MTEKDPKAEIEAMARVSEVLAGLDESGRSRVLRWAVDHYQIPVGLGAALGAPRSSVAPSDSANSPSLSIDLAELFLAAAPKTDGDKALVVGYWLQFVGGAPDLDSQAVNAELKHLGYGVKNITMALSSLGKKKPQLVIQTRKSGTTQQARKKYKVTAAGKAAVERMVEGTPEK